MVISWENTIYRIGMSLLFVLFGVLVVFNVLGEEAFFERAGAVLGVVSEDVEVVAEIITPEIGPIELPDGFAIINSDLKFLLPSSNQEYRSGKAVSLGAYFPNLSTRTFDQVVNYEDLIAHKLRYLLIYRAWGDGLDANFPSDMIPYFIAMETVPIVTWEPWARDFEQSSDLQPEYSLASIADGKHDDYIKIWAKEVKDAKIFIIIRFGHEQSTPEGYRYWYPWQGNSRDYIRAYRHIVDVFEAEGAKNARFMWNPAAFWSRYDSATYYPGDDYVDLVGLTVLNHGIKTGGENEKWLTCRTQFTAQMDRISKVDKPVMVVEFASSEIGGDKKAWYLDCLDTIDNAKNVIGLVTLENPKDSSHESVDWRVNTSNEALEGFIRGINGGNYR